MKKGDDLFYYFHTNLFIPRNISKLFSEAKKESGDRLPVVVLKNQKGETFEIIKRPDLERAAKKMMKNAQGLWEQFLIEKLLINRK
jgi:hypothetical protein